MSNPAVCALAETEIKGSRVRIEDNLGESIHIHVGDLRISLSISEFNAFVDQVQLAAEELLNLNGIGLRMFDKTSFDWNWLGRYEHIVEINKTYVKIGDLLTKGESNICSEIDVIIPVDRSRQYKALTGDDSELKKRSQTNLHGQTNLERLQETMKSIKKHGYPYNDKLIIVNQYNQIYDGDHRAACLLYLEGREKLIPVIKITFDDQSTIEAQIEDEKRRIDRQVNKNNSLIKPVYQWSEELNKFEGSFNEFERKLQHNNIDYFCIDHIWSDPNGKVVGDKVIIIGQGSMIDFCKKMNVSYYGKSIYRKYRFLYSMQRSVYIESLNARIMVLDCLACKSKFEDAILPLENSIQKYAMDKSMNHRACREIEFIYVIVDSMLNGCGFNADSEEYVQKNIDLADSIDVKMMLKSIFYNYSEKLLAHLSHKEYELAYIDWIRNIDY